MPAMPPLTAPNPAPVPPSRKPWLILVIVAVVLIALGVGAYFLLKPSDRNATNDANSKSSAASNAKPLSDLNSVTLTGPAAPTGYTKNDTGIPTFIDYSKTTGTAGCEFIFGTATATQVPGTDIGDIVAKSLEPYRQEGDTIVGPQVSTALLLNDSKDSKIQYSMPTLNYDITVAKTGGRLISHYSGVVLKNGDRAIVNRVCADKSGKVDTAPLGVLDNLAGTIVVTAK